MPEWQDNGAGGAAAAVAGAGPLATGRAIIARESAVSFMAQTCVRIPVMAPPPSPFGFSCNKSVQGFFYD